MKTDILLVGDTSIDQFMLIDDASVSCDINHQHCRICFDFAGKIHVKEFRTSVAGNATNVAVGTATLGLKSTLYTETGDDYNAELAIKTLRERGVNTEFVHTNKNTPSDIHPIAVFQGERTIFSYHEKRQYKMQNWGIPKFLYYTSLSEGFESFHDELFEFVNNHPEIIFVLNPGTTQMRVGINKLREILPRLDILISNREEAIGIVGKEVGIDELHKELHAKGTKLTVITDSLNGASSYDGENIEKIGVCETDLVTEDKTGAGDAFASAFVSAIHYGKTAKEALRWGSINSSYKISKIGSIEGLLNKEQIEEILKTAKFSEPKV